MAGSQTWHVLILLSWDVKIRFFNDYEAQKRDKNQPNNTKIKIKFIY